VRMGRQVFAAVVDWSSRRSATRHWLRPTASTFGQPVVALGHVRNPIGVQPRRALPSRSGAVALLNTVIVTMIVTMMQNTWLMPARYARHSNASLDADTCPGSKGVVLIARPPAPAGRPVTLAHTPATAH
jgi:hypothetical protein